MEVRQLEAAIWSVADGYGSDADLALLDADERASLFVLDRLVGEAEDLDAAKAEFRKAFDAVLYWCSSERGGVVRWQGGSSRADPPEL